MIAIMSESNLTGWDTYDVEIEGRVPEDGGVYKGLIVTGRCGPTIPEWSEEVTVETPAGGHRTMQKGLYFDLSQYDGSDFFMAPERGFVFVTERVKEAFRRNKVTNVDFTPVTEVLLDRISYP